MKNVRRANYQRRGENHPAATEAPLLRKEGSYRSALDRLKRCEDRRGETIWVEEMGTDGKPNVYYKYDSNGRLMKHTRSLYGYSVACAEYRRFGEAVDR